MADPSQVLESQSLSKGKLIVFEGLDKAGKETQVTMLKRYLKGQGLEVATHSFPDYETDTGEFIQRYLRGREQVSQKTINLMYSANRYVNKSRIEYLLNKGAIVICDRYYYSNMAYGSFDGQTEDEIEAMDSEMPKPDLVVYIDISVKESLKRSGKTADKNESNYEYLEMVRNGYRMLATNREWFSVNGEEDKQEIHEQIVSLVENRLFKNKQ